MNYELSPELKAKIRADREETAANIALIWRNGLSHKDWMFDGAPITKPRQIERFNALDWSRAWIDLGPSPAGNFGPYWHVPLVEDDDETIHRLYPKVLLSKWGILILHACNEAARKANQD